MEKQLNVEQTAMLVGVSAKTINNWYWFKRTHPEHELAQKLPDYVQAHEKATRYWRMEDVYTLIEFRNSIPHGRNGILGDVTQKWTRKRRTEHGTKKSGRRNVVNRNTR